MAGYKYQLAVRGSVSAPRQMMLDPGRFAVLVNAEETDVQIIPGILEVIRVAAVERDLLLGSEHEADIGVALEAIEVVLASLV